MTIVFTMLTGRISKPFRRKFLGIQEEKSNKNGMLSKDSNNHYLLSLNTKRIQQRLFFGVLTSLKHKAQTLPILLISTQHSTKILMPLARSTSTIFPDHCTSLKAISFQDRIDTSSFILKVPIKAKCNESMATLLAVLISLSCLF